MMRRRLFLVAVACGSLWSIGCTDGSPIPTEPEDRRFSLVGAEQGSIVLRRPPTDGVSYTVRLKDNVELSEARARGLAEPVGGRVTHVFRHALRGFRVVLPNEAAARALEGNTDILYIVPDTVGRDVGFGTQSPAPWGLDRIDQRTRPLNSAYTYFETGAGVHVFVLDTGIDGDHPDLSSWISQSYVGSWIPNSSPFTDCHGHGTHVSAVAVSARWGVSKGALIHPMQVGDCNKSFNRGDVAEAVDWVMTWALNYGQWPAVINYSAGSEVDIWPKPHEEAMRNAVAAGIPVVVAAGNAGQDACNWTPARVAELITVAGISVSADSRYTGTGPSNYGSCVDIFAPGESVPTASNTGGETYGAGTSIAAPHVTGLVAMILGDAAVSPWLASSVLGRGGTVGVLSNIGAGSPNLLAYARYTQVRIGGPDEVDIEGQYQWSATAYGGNKSYTYQWLVKPDGQAQWEYIIGATGPSLSRYVGAGEPNFSLQVRVVSDGEEVADTLYVHNLICTEDPEQEECNH